MSSTIAGTARRFALTLTLAGVAALGSVVVAPAASAASDVVIRTGDNGPAAFVELEHGRMPVFECDEDNPNKRHNNCLDVNGETRF